MFTKNAKALIADHDADAGFLHRYLLKFGGVKAKSINEDVLAEFLSLWQKILGLKATGLPDAATVKALRFTPRCGCPDKPQLMKRGAWNKGNLSYRFDGFVSGLSQSEQKQIVAQAFGSWAAVANLQFAESLAENADFSIGIGQGRRDGFDGPSGVLAWAYLPAGDDRPLTMKFDADETWITDPRSRGILMLNVAAHEFGHLLGLEHSSVQGALMSPYYAPAVASPQAADDVPRIQRLYGPPKSAPVPVPPAAGALTLDLGDLNASGRAKLALAGRKEFTLRV